MDYKNLGDLSGYGLAETIRFHVAKNMENKLPQLFSLGMNMYPVLKKVEIVEQFKLHEEFLGAFLEAGGENYTNVFFVYKAKKIQGVYNSWVKKANKEIEVFEKAEWQKKVSRVDTIAAVSIASLINKSSSDFDEKVGLVNKCIDNYRDAFINEQWQIEIAHHTMTAITNLLADKIRYQKWIGVFYAAFDPGHADEFLRFVFENTGSESLRGRLRREYSDAVAA